MIDIQTQAEVEYGARARVANALPDMRHSFKQIARGKPLSCERDPQRRQARLAAKRAALGAGAMDSAEKAFGSIDFVGVSFFDLGRRRAQSVCRIAQGNGVHQGTGFLVAPGLLLTNNHVIPSAATAQQLQAQFNLENDASGTPRPITSFDLDPASCFVTSEWQALDFTLVAIGARRAGTAALQDFGYIPLSDAPDKHMLGETANIIQHPQGRAKEIVIRDNRIVARDDTEVALHYITDTERGSSGSPVFNDEWQPIALHHWSSPLREIAGKSGTALAKEVNEGIRISAIVKQLRVEAQKPGAVQKLTDALALWDQGMESSQPLGLALLNGDGAEVGDNNLSSRRNADGSITIIYPVEITLRLPAGKA